MPELSELEVVQKGLNRRIVNQTITSAGVIPPGSPISVRNLTGTGFSPELTGATFASVCRRGKFLTFVLRSSHPSPVRVDPCGR